MRKLLYLCLVFLCLGVFSFAEPIKAYSDFKSFYADWDKYRVITEYCYMYQDPSQKQQSKDTLGLSIEISEGTRISNGQAISAKEYFFTYTKKTGEVFVMVFTNTTWNSYKMFETKLYTNSYIYEGFDAGMNAWNILISATEENKASSEQLTYQDLAGCL